MKTKDFLKTLDVALLKPDVTMRELFDMAQMCANLGVGTLCVKSCDVRFAVDCLRGSKTKPIAVVGFPHGNTLGSIKAIEAQMAVAQGAEEIDMVINVSALKDGDIEGVKDEIQMVVTAAYPAPVKVILETALLTPGEIRNGVACAIKAGAAYVKTSTGFASEGATPDVVKIMLLAAKDKIKVKASGGIRTREVAEAYLAMGCERLGVGQVLPLLSRAEKKRLGFEVEA